MVFLKMVLLNFLFVLCMTEQRPESSNDSQVSPSLLQAQTSPLVPSVPYSGKENLVIDTSENEFVSSGNWVKKRQYLLDARVQQENSLRSVKEIVKTGEESYTKRFIKFQEELEVFYKKISRTREAIEEVIEFFLKESDLYGKIPYTNERDRVALLEKRKSFDQARIDLKSLVSIEKAMKSRIEKLDEYIASAHSKYADISKVIDEIFPLFDHKKAKNLYYQVENISKYIQAVEAFLKNDLLKDFSATLDNALSLIDGLSKKMPELLELLGKMPANNFSKESFLNEGEINSAAISSPQFQENKIEKVEKESIPKSWSLIDLFFDFYDSLVERFSLIFTVFYDLFSLFF